MRARYGIYAARQIAVPDAASQGLLVMVHELPDGLGMQMTALNFGAAPVEETVRLTHVAAAPVVDMMDGEAQGALGANGELALQLAGREGKSFLIQTATAS